MKRFNFVCASLAILLFCASLFAQTPAKLAFEVASIKPSPPLSSLITEIQSGKLDMGIRIDGSRLDLKFMPLAALLAQAYKLKPYQISGPDWIKTQLFEIHAKLPEGSNKDQIPEMMQTLLAERFNLTFHRETKELPIYALIVGKDGLKLKAVAEEPAPAAAAGDPAKTAPGTENAGKEGQTTSTPQGEMKMDMKQEGVGMVINMNIPGTGKVRMVVDPAKGTMRMEIPKIKMDELAEMLTQFTDRQVVDRTDVKGAYEVPLELPLQDLMNMAKKMMPELMGASGGGAGAPGASAPSSGLAGTGASDPSGGSMFQAVQKLGLKLDARKEPTETIIVDRANKEPTEN
jgi:uncharacterized protein (TIGR03435 family)